MTWIQSYCTGFAGVDFDAGGADPFVEDGCKISDCS